MGLRLPSILSAPSLGRQAEDAGRALQLAAVVLLLQSVFWTARIPIFLKLATVGLAALSFVHPGGALLVVAGLLPFANVLVTRVWNVYPFALAEAIVLAFLAGYLLRSWRWRETGEAWRDSLSTPANLFAIVVLASCAVQLVVLQTWHDYPLAYAARFLHYLVYEYLTTVPDIRPWVQGEGFVRTAALLLEGVGLMLAVRALCRARPGLDGRTLLMLVSGATGAALLTLVEVSELVLAGKPAFHAPTVGFRRFSGFIASLDTSGPYFGMLLFAALAVVLGPATARTARLSATVGAVLLAGAMWLTRTRSAILAAFAVTIAGIVWVLAVRTRRVRPLTAVTIGGILAVAMTVAVIAVEPWSLMRSDVYPWFHLRKLLALTALHMVASHPFSGVGIAQYPNHYAYFSTPELLAVHPMSDAHNYFLWIAAELGLIGVMTLGWLLISAAYRAWQRLRGQPEDLGFAAVCAGLSAFAITWLTGQPLSVRLVAYTFWILVGIATNASTLRDAARWVAPGDGPRLTWRRTAIVAFVVVVVVSVPIRARRAVAGVDLSRVSYGFHLWEIEGLGVKYRWTGPRVTFFEPVSVRAIDLPVRAPFDPARVGAEAFEVRILVNGERAGMALLTDDRWQQLTVPAPAAQENARVWRVDLEVSPTWRPARLFPGSTDPRTLGVKIGEITPHE